jgi:hypothetical protein
LWFFSYRKFGYCDYSPFITGGGKPIQQAVLPNWSAWSLTEQLPSRNKRSQEFGHSEACKSFLR